MDKTPLALAAAAPIALGGIVAARAGDPAPMFAIPAIVFGVVAATAPALYIGSAAAGGAPTVGGVARALVAALGAFGIALAGFVLPAAFLAFSSLAPTTTLAIASLALAGAGVLALRRLALELRTPLPSVGPRAVFAVWSLATLGIAGRLWFDFAGQVMS